MNISRLSSVLLFSAMAWGIVACNKENSAAGPATSSDDLTAAISSTQSIAVASSSSSRVAGDSIYVVNTCPKGSHRDSVSFSGLPSAITDYLSANYTGYTAPKAFTIKDSSGTVKGYVTIIQYNGKPVGLLFDAGGNFVRVLEQRQGRDLIGIGWHRGGCFDHRDGLGRDSVALSALPASILSYFSTNYPQDTLVRAFKGFDSGYVVISKNNGLFATAFTSGGAFIKRVELPSFPGKIASLTEAALPSSVQSYLTTTYPGYVFEHAFSITINGTLKGYVVVIDANNTKYAVKFEASGSFVKAVTVR